MTTALDSLALLWALFIYRRRILPTVRTEQRRWRIEAAAIPDPALRAAALGALDRKGSNAEATAVFAILAPRRQRPAVVRAIVALQTAVDYLDTVSERPSQDRLANGLALHEALSEALTPGGQTSDWYRLNAECDDGGYLAALVAACRDAVAPLPGADAVLPAARRAARRCAEGQGHTHAAVEDGAARLRAWAEGLCPPGYHWWEAAAGASSSVAVHALIAAAGDPRTGSREPDAIDAAYFPSIGTLTVLLDDLVDRDEDRATNEHNYIAYYGELEIAAERLAAMAAEAQTATRGLRQRHLHAAILAGVAGYYLSSLDADDRRVAPLRAGLLTTLGAPARLAAKATQTARGPGMVPR